MGGSNSVMTKGVSQADKYQVQSSQQQQISFNNSSSQPSPNKSSSQNSFRKSFTPLPPPDSALEDDDDNADEVLYTSSEYFDKELPVWFYSSNYGSSGSRRGSLKKTRSLVMNAPTEEVNKTPPRSTSYQKLHKQDSPPSPTHSNSSPQLFATPPRPKPSLLTSVLKNSSPQTTPPPPKSNQVSPSHHCTSNTDFSSFSPVQSPSIPIRRDVFNDENNRSRSQSVPINTNNFDRKTISKRNSITCLVSESEDDLQILITPPASPPEHLSPTNSLTIRSIDSEMRLAKREKREKKKRMLELKRKQELAATNITVISQANLPPLFQKLQLHSGSNRMPSKELNEESKQMIRVK